MQTGICKNIHWLCLVEDRKGPFAVPSQGTMAKEWASTKHPRAHTRLHIKVYIQPLQLKYFPWIFERYCSSARVLRHRIRSTLFRYRENLKVKPYTVTDS